MIMDVLAEDNCKNVLKKSIVNWKIIKNGWSH